MTTDWTRRSFTGTFRKFRHARGGRVALISEIVDTSGVIKIDWAWLPCPPELCYVCTHAGAEIAFECDCRFYPLGIEIANGKRIYFKLQRAGRPLHMKRRSVPTKAQICALKTAQICAVNLPPIGGRSELDDWLHLG